MDQNQNPSPEKTSVAETTAPAAVSAMPETSSAPERKAPEATPVAPAEKPSGVMNGGVTLAQALVIALLSSGISGYLAYAAASRQVPATPSVALVDANYLMMAQLSSMAKAGDKTPTQMANQFVDGMSRVMTYYASHGVLVINSTDALNKPAGIDITEQVAKSMGIELPAPGATLTQPPQATPPAAPAPADTAPTPVPASR